MIDQYYNHSIASQRRTQDFAKSRRISPASKRLYTGASMEEYDEELYREHNVKRGLRNADGSGVVAGLTRISDVHGYRKEDGVFIPDEGKLTIRGYDIADLIDNAHAEDRFGYEELAYLLLTGALPATTSWRALAHALAACACLKTSTSRSSPSPPNQRAS